MRFLFYKHLKQKQKQKQKQKTKNKKTKKQNADPIKYSLTKKSHKKKR